MAILDHTLGILINPDQEWQRILALAYPWLTLFSIVVTANHYWFDAVGGIVVLAAGCG